MDRGKHDEVMDEGVKRSRHGQTHPSGGYVGKYCESAIGKGKSLAIILAALCHNGLSQPSAFAEI